MRKLSTKPQQQQLKPAQNTQNQKNQPQQTQKQVVATSNAQKTLPQVPPQQIIVKKVETIQLSFQKSNQIQQSLQQLEQNLKGCHLSNIRLIMKTIFESDKDAILFSTSLMKLLNYPFKYLEWVVQGNFTDEGQAKCVGEIISRFSGLYSLSINISQSFFGDVGAKSLAKGLLRLVNLHHLKVFISQMHGKVYKKMTEVGSDAIMNNVLALPNLEMLEHNLSLPLEIPIPQKIASLRKQFIYNQKYLDFDDNIFLEKKKYRRSTCNLFQLNSIALLFKMMRKILPLKNKNQFLKILPIQN